MCACMCVSGGREKTGRHGRGGCCKVTPSSPSPLPPFRTSLPTHTPTPTHPPLPFHNVADKWLDGGCQARLNINLVFI